MNCWKEINLTKQYGTQRVCILSIITMLFTFILLYVPANYLFVPSTLEDNYFLFLIAALWLMYPIHKIIHFFSLVHLKNKIKKTFKIKYLVMPVIQIQIIEPISKWQYILTLILPFILINGFLFTACWIFNNYVHYFTILLAFHIGLCVSDFIYIKNVLKAPNRAYIEENENGFEILVNHPNLNNHNETFLH
ncbi:DUF3267 domain-containing protein [Bacillus tuaregi]|uniref:DUF3267 domain-containing protein n=1 Tax=Bacillus tuaregi TaxID=1816695 RepID=UPI001F2235C8|nr:DUF3267 domain-containing protein [Bacillus tuaregi]